MTPTPTWLEALIQSLTKKHYDFAMVLLYGNIIVTNTFFFISLKYIRTTFKYYMNMVTFTNQLSFFVFKLILLI